MTFANHWKLICVIKEKSWWAPICNAVPESPKNWWSSSSCWFVSLDSSWQHQSSDFESRNFGRNGTFGWCSAAVHSCPWKWKQQSGCSSKKYFYPELLVFTFQVERIFGDENVLKSSKVKENTEKYILLARKHNLSLKNLENTSLVDSNDALYKKFKNLANSNEKVALFFDIVSSNVSIQNSPSLTMYLECLAELLMINACSHKINKQRILSIAQAVEKTFDRESTENFSDYQTALYMLIFGISFSVFQNPDENYFSSLLSRQSDLQKLIFKVAIKLYKPKYDYFSEIASVVFSNTLFYIFHFNHLLRMCFESNKISALKYDPAYIISRLTLIEQFHSNFWFCPIKIWICAGCHQFSYYYWWTGGWSLMW